MNTSINIDGFNSYSKEKTSNQGKIRVRVNKKLGQNTKLREKLENQGKLEHQRKIKKIRSKSKNQCKIKKIREKLNNYYICRLQLHTNRLIRKILSNYKKNHIITINSEENKKFRISHGLPIFVAIVLFEGNDD